MRRHDVLVHARGVSSVCCTSTTVQRDGIVRTGGSKMKSVNERESVKRPAPRRSFLGSGWHGVRTQELY